MKIKKKKKLKSRHAAISVLEFKKKNYEKKREIRNKNEFIDNLT